MTAPTWSNSTRKLSELKAWAQNPRQIDIAGAEALELSLIKFGQVETIAIEPDNTIVDGHQRENVWMASEKFGPDYEVRVSVCSRQLTEAERKGIILALHKGAVGEFDMDALANLYDVDELLAGGFSEKELQLSGFDVIDHLGEDKSGASPWDRMSGDSADGVLFTFGEITCRVDKSVYDAFLSNCPNDDIAGYIAGIILV
jgi:hypothetical protein